MAFDGSGRGGVQRFDTFDMMARLSLGGPGGLPPIDMDDREPWEEGDGSGLRRPGLMMQIACATVIGCALVPYAGGLATVGFQAYGKVEDYVVQQANLRMAEMRKIIDARQKQAIQRQLPRR